jgi:phosphoribosylanthranilate isomerase
VLSIPLLAYGITHLTDARYFAAWHPDYLCFPLGTEGLSLDYFVAIREWVEGPVCVAELGADAGANFRPETLTERNITHLLVDEGSTYPTQGFTTITRLPIAGYHLLADLSDKINETPGILLLDFTSGGITYGDLEEGHPFTPDQLRGVIGERSVYFRIDFVPIAIGTSAPRGLPGLAVRGSGEEKVGYKSFDELNDLFEVLEEV